MLVVDASTVTAALIDRRPKGRWAERLLAQNDLVAPHFLLVEVANVLRCAELNGRMRQTTATHAHANLVTSPIELYPYLPLAARIWELRKNVTPYDAWYVALAEALDAPLATLDERLTRAPGPRCRFEVFPDSA